MRSIEGCSRSIFEGTGQGFNGRARIGLKENVNTIDDTIGFAASDMGKKIFGEERAASMVKKGNEVKAAGGKYCFCPACQAGSEIYANRASL